MARFLTGLLSLALAVIFGLIARHGNRTGEAFSGWPYPPVRRETHRFLFPFLHWLYVGLAVLLTIAGIAAILGVTR